MPRPSVDNDSSPFRRFGKSKKSHEEALAPAFKAAVLPSTDDFRTSLLMTGLSARFSMLREQDDPLSMLGKASDDSVLQPKRQSRLMDFGHPAGLGDIAEVESIRPTYLTREFSGLSDDSQGASIMNRSRPNEGNNLFGGRQKVYKIAPGSRSGATGGRAVYDDDLAKTSFQKWRQAQRDGYTQGSILDEIHDLESPTELSRQDIHSASSSLLSAGRSSTAASSFTSQYASSIKDGQLPTPVGSATSMERNVTRTRRMYEHGLNKELLEQQSSALSRIDTLSRTRLVTSPRSGDSNAQSPRSPTLASYMERPSEKRGLFTKASAPNLRSFTPPTSQTPLTPSESLNQPDLILEKATFGGHPPLSPPISEAEDQPAHPTASAPAAPLGLFNRAQQYDDAKYAERQRELQRGRESVGTQAASESGNSGRFPRSSSTTSSLRTTSDKSEAYVLQREQTRSSLARSSTGEDLPVSAAEDEERNSLVSLAAGLRDSHNLERPDDQDHPAFRKSALPTPLALSRPSTSSADKPSLAPPAGNTLNTLPPSASGLSGLVRQHLRQESNVSSNYDGEQDESETTSSSPSQPERAPGRIAATTSAWSMTESEFNPESGHVTPYRPESLQAQDEGNRDPEFARNLADGARKVREKLTSYAESDGEQPAPPSLRTSVSRESQPRSSNPLGILRSRSSRGSLFDRNRDRDSGESKKEEIPKVPSLADASQAVQAAISSAPVAPVAPTKEQAPEGIHAGLKAFRQARRELQKMKELEARQRRGGDEDDQADRPVVQRAASDEHSIMTQERNGSDAADNAPFETGRPRALSRPRGDFSQSPYEQHPGRPRNGSLLSGASSTPNLRAPMSAPPLPPINPRRKTAYGDRQSNDSSPQLSPRLMQSEDGMMFPAPNQDMGADGRRQGVAMLPSPSKDNMAADPRRQGMRRVISDNTGRPPMYPPPPSRRPPIPQSMSSDSMPGGMF